MATYIHPVTGEIKEYRAFADLSPDLQKLIKKRAISLVGEASMQCPRGIDWMIANCWKEVPVLLAIAKNGFYLERLADHPFPQVRAEVARQGYLPERFVEDVPEVRAGVAEAGCMLDVLINDPEPEVRAACARAGYKLDVLVHDRHHDVRAAVAEQGFGLDVLINDQRSEVSNVAAHVLSRYLSPHDVLKIWAAENPDKCVLAENQAKGQVPTIECAKEAQKGRQRPAGASRSVKAKM